MGSAPAAAAPAAPPKPQPNLDKVGIWWLSWAGIWTFFVVCGMVYLISKRHMPMLRIRGLGLSLVAITMLHLYWISAQLGYVIGPLAPAIGEYWIMGTYFPLGIALFQASNSRFLHVAKMQSKYADQDQSQRGPRPRKAGLINRIKRLDYTAKMLIMVGCGMVFQIFLTLFFFLISRRFHSNFGIPGTEVHGTEMEQKLAMGKGWEWWPTCFWQLFWAWIFAPIILWKSRNIRDTQGWRTQTLGCAISGLPATPMWLIAVHVPAMQTVNQYFIPPQWIGISIILMEVFTIFLPCWEVLRQQSLHKETLDSIAQWESKNKFNHDGRSLNSGTTVIDSIITGKKSLPGSVHSTSNESILTMSALEYVLERNPAPLQEFSALRDFSGENIAFLTSVAEWKASLPPSAQNNASANQDPQTRELVRERFNRALRIYAEFVSNRDADFPINISSPDFKKLEAIFEKSARIMYGEKRVVDSATPFDLPTTAESASTTSGSEKEMIMRSGSCAEDRVQFWGEIPESFDETVFDDAEKSIKYLVLTNTWPKFVKNRRTSIDADAENGNAIKA